MFEFAVRKPVILTVAILIVCIFGINAVYEVPKQMIPDLDARVVSVRTQWPGATPQDVEKEIIIEQEDYLRNIPNLDRMISTASTGSARVELEFLHGTDLTDVLIRVNNALAQVPDYPENVDEPRIVTTSTSDNPFMFFRVVPLPGNPHNVNVGAMRDFIIDHVGTQVERVQGVAEVEVWGGADRQIQIPGATRRTRDYAARAAQCDTRTQSRRLRRRPRRGETTLHRAHDRTLRNTR